MTITLYEVGGCVRDRILGVKSKDIDYAVEVPGARDIPHAFELVGEEIRARGGEIYLETPQYFTIRANVPGIGAADFVLCRCEGAYTDNRHPDDVAIGTIFDDLARRDFTMNAIAVRQSDGEMIDPFGGLIDINDGVIRCVGNTHDRMTEDRLRILRAIRFSITKNMVFDPILHRFLRNLTPDCLTGVSAERVREELDKMLRVSSRETFETLLFHFPGVADAVFQSVGFVPTLAEPYRP